MFSVSERKPAPAAAIRSMMCSTSFSERDRRSSFQTTTASPSRSAPAYGAARVGPNGQREIRDRTFENQSFRASGLSLIAAAIVHWNTVYLDRAVRHLRARGVIIPDDLLAHVAPLGWEHIALTGDYIWNGGNPGTDFRPLCEVRTAFLPQVA